MSSPEPIAVPDEQVELGDEPAEQEARSFIRKAVGILNDLLEVKVVTAVDTVDVFMSTTDDATATTLKTDKALEKSIVTVVKITDGDVTTVISESLLDNTELRAYHEAQVAKSMQVLPDNLRALVEIARSIVDHVTEDQPMAKLSTAAKNIFDDLLTLEVNVVLKPGMTARKLPEPVQALLDVMGDYDTWLGVFAGRLNPAWTRYQRAATRAGAGPPDLPERTLKRVWDEGGLKAVLPYQPICEGDATEVTIDAFDDLRERAKTAEVMYRLLLNEGRFPGGDDGSGIILKRIYRNCDQIKGVLARQAGGEGKPAAQDLTRKTTSSRVLQLSADDVLIVRKVWEVGTETIAMQTVAQIDGDVVTRIQEARATLADRPVHDLHREAVGNAMKHWQFLVETLVTVTTKAAGFLFR